MVGPARPTAASARLLRAQRWRQPRSGPHANALDSGRNGGFSSADPEVLWLPVCVDYEALNVEAQLLDDGSSLNLYRRLLAVRKQSDALRRGDYRQHPATDERCLVYMRTAGEESKLVALNLTSEPCELAIPDRGTIVLSTATDGAGVRLEGLLRLAADEGVVIEVDRS